MGKGKHGNSGPDNSAETPPEKEMQLKPAAQDAWSARRRLSLGSEHSSYQERERWSSPPCTCQSERAWEPASWETTGLKRRQLLAPSPQSSAPGPCPQLSNSQTQLQAPSSQLSNPSPQPQSLSSPTSSSPATPYLTQTK